MLALVSQSRSTQTGTEALLLIVGQHLLERRRQEAALGMTSAVAHSALLAHFREQPQCVQMALEPAGDWIENVVKLVSEMGDEARSQRDGELIRARNAVGEGLELLEYRAASRDGSRPRSRPTPFDEAPGPLTASPH